MKHIVAGHGEVGTALAEFLGCDWTDLTGSRFTETRYDVLHVAFPYSFGFAAAVEDYRRMFRPTHVVVHSSVPVGTCDALGAVHSPVRGVHPNLFEGLRTFVKFFGGPGAGVMATEWPGTSRVLRDARTCEALKLWETTQYGVFIRLMQEIHRYCDANGLPFDEVYRLSNFTYNDGYRALHRTDVLRPALRYEGPGIGGHCVLPNAELLGGPVAALVRDGFDESE